MRDQDLAAAYKSTEYKPPPDTVGGFDIVVRPNVFPPDQGLSTNLLIRAVGTVSEKFFPEIPRNKKVGIDVGTGTGVLALALAKYCSVVYATDVDNLAVDNARKNYENNKAKLGEVRFEVLPPDDLLKLLPIEKLDTEIEKDSRLMLVFNHPFYPSPLDLYHIGGEDAGSEIVRKFLRQAEPLLRKFEGAVIMSYSDVAEGHNPVSVARTLGFESTEISRESRRIGDESLSDYVYMFRLQSPRTA